MMVPQPFNVGIVGYGSSAKTFHIPLIICVAELKLYAVVQRNPTPESNAEKDLPGIKSYRSTQDMVRDEGVDVVVVTTTPETHFELAKLALESGKHGAKNIRQSIWLSPLPDYVQLWWKSHSRPLSRRPRNLYLSRRTLGVS